MYAVALISYFDNELKMTTIESDSVVDAMLGGTKKILGPGSDWVDCLKCKTEEDVKEVFFNMDMSIGIIKIEESNGKVR